MAEILKIAGDRVLVGLEACWEVDALCELARDLTEDVGRATEQHLQMRHALKLRGVLLRIERLNSALVSLLGDADDTPSLQKKVFGAAPAKEARHA